MEPPREVVADYDRFAEELRLEQGPFQLEFARTKDILGRLLPSQPARIVDVGGAAGAYSAWLASRGHEVHLVDASPRLVEEARRRNATLRDPIASLTVADARSLPQPSQAADVVRPLTASFGAWLLIRRSFESAIATCKMVSIEMTPTGSTTLRPRISIGRKA